MKKQIAVGFTSLVLASQISQADVAMTQVVTINATGGLAMMASTTTSKQVISGDRSRSDSRTEMQSSMMRMFAGNDETTSILRLDRELIWNLEPKKKRYTEMTFADLKAQQAQMTDAMSGGGATGVPVDEESCEWSEPDISIEHPGDTRSIVGHSAEKHIVSMKQSCTDTQTKNTCEMAWELEAWVAEGLPGEKEVIAFQRNMAKAMGSEELSSSLGGSAAGLLSMFGNNWNGIASEFSKIGGYTLAMTMQLDVGGPDCSPSEGGGGSSPTDMMGAATEIMGSLGGMFGGSKEEKQEPKPEPATPDNGMMTVFSIESEVTAWDKANASDSDFDVPGDYAKAN